VECFVTCYISRVRCCVTPRPSTKLKDQLLSAVLDCLNNILAAILHIWRPLLHPNLRARNTVVGNILNLRTEKTRDINSSVCGTVKLNVLLRIVGLYDPMTHHIITIVLPHVYCTRRRKGRGMRRKRRICIHQGRKF
jgi:hypothetical protein